MYKISKADFCKILAIRPRSVIGKEIVLEYDDEENVKFAKILDVSLGGNYMLVECPGMKTWIKPDKLDKMIIMDSPPEEREDIISIMSKEFKILSSFKELMAKCDSDKKD